MTDGLYDQWTTEGYIVVRGLFTPARAERLRVLCEAILQQWRVKNPETGEPGGGPDAIAMRHLNHPGYFGSNQETLGELMEAVADESVLGVCRTILDAQPLFRCTSLFMNPTENSNDGSWHRDSQFITPDEEAERAMVESRGVGGDAIQLQVALVPSDDVEYVPGSHRRWDTPEEYAIRRVDDGAQSRSNAMPGALRVALEPGDAVAFNPFGLHRGRYHVDKLRRTLMLTYTKPAALRADYFSHQPWFLEPGYMGALSPRARAFFETFIAAHSADWTPQDAAVRA